jgi:hypothetical protein
MRALTHRLHLPGLSQWYGLLVVWINLPPLTPRPQRLVMFHFTIHYAVNGLLLAKSMVFGNSKKADVGKESVVTVTGEGQCWLRLKAGGLTRDLPPSEKHRSAERPMAVGLSGLSVTHQAGRNSQ